MRSISRKTAAWVSGAVIAVGGTTAGIIAATSSGGGTAAGGGATANASVAAHAKTVPLRLVSITPGDDARAVNGAAGVTVTYNEPLPATATMPMTSQASRCRFFSGRALSMTARSRNGEASPTMEEAAMMAVTTASGQR